MANILDLAERFIESKTFITSDAKRAVAWGMANGMVSVTAPEHGADYWLSKKRRQKEMNGRKLAKIERLKLKIIALGGKN